MRQAIAEESAKYSARSTPCSWRLETTTFFAGYGNNRQVTYHVSINICNQEFESFLLWFIL